jgi:hypothetical protein
MWIYISFQKTQRADSIPNMQSIIAALDGVRP